MGLVATGFSPVGAAFLGVMGLRAALGAAAVLAISGFAFLAAVVTFGPDSSARQRAPAVSP